jgi:hypothetical protein
MALGLDRRRTEAVMCAPLAEAKGSDVVTLPHLAGRSVGRGSARGAVARGCRCRSVDGVGGAHPGTHP